MMKQFEAEGFTAQMQAEADMETYKGTVRACHFDSRAVGGVSSRSSGSLGC
jgi:hypothetical protein